MEFAEERLVGLGPDSKLTEPPRMAQGSAARASMPSAIMDMELTLYPRRSRAIGLLLVCSAFVAIGIWMGFSGERPGFLCAAFFGLGIPAAVIQLLPGSTFLRIDSEGITFANLFRKTSLPWPVFDEFFVVTLRQTGLKVHEMVGFNFVPTYDRARLGRAVAKVLGQSEGALPDTYGKKAEELAAILNARLQAASSGTT